MSVCKCSRLSARGREKSGAELIHHAVLRIWMMGVGEGEPVCTRNSRSWQAIELKEPREKSSREVDTVNMRCRYIESMYVSGEISRQTNDPLVPYFKLHPSLSLPSNLNATGIVRKL